MDPFAIIDEFYAKEDPAREILLEHARLVADMALEIARRMDLPAGSRQFVWEAAVLHDVGIRRTHLPDLGCFGREPYLCHGVLGRSMLEERGLFEHALVCERHVGTGITARDVQKHNLPLPQRDMRPQTVEEQIVCYADKFFSKDKTGRKKSLAQVEAGLLPYGREKVEAFQEMHQRFGLAA